MNLYSVYEQQVGLLKLVAAIEAPSSTQARVVAKAHGIKWPVVQLTNQEFAQVLATEKALV